MKYIKRTLLIFVAVFGLLVGIQNYIATRNFKELLTNILNSSGLNVEFDTVKLEKLNKIVIKNLKVKDMKDNIVINSPETVATINIMMPSRLLRVDINHPIVNLERQKNNHFNIFDVLKSTPQKHPVYDKTSRLGKIYINNAILNYSDISFNQKIEKQLKNVNGFLETTKSRGFILEAKGKGNDEELGIKLGVGTITVQNFNSLFNEQKNKNESKKNYYVNFQFKNVKVNEKLGQYVPINLIKVKSGILNGNLLLTNKNVEKQNVVEGNLDIKSGILNYVDYDGTLKNITAKVILKSEKITVDGNSKINGGDLGLALNYLPKDQKLKLNLDIKNVNYSEIAKYKILKGLKLPLKGLINGNLKVNFDQKKQEVLLKSKINSNELNVNGFKFKNVSTEMKMDKNQKISFNNTKAYFEHILNGFHVKTDINMSKFEYDTKNKQGKGQFVLHDKGSDHTISVINGNLTLLPNNDVEINFNSKEIDGNVKIDVKAMTILVNTNGKQNFDIKYNGQNYRVNPDIYNLLLDLRGKNVLKSGEISTDLVMLNNKMIGVLKAQIDINNGIYNIKAKSNKLAGYELGLDVNLTGDGSKFTGDYKIFSAYGNKGIEYENLTATGKIHDLSHLNLDIDVFIEEVWIGYQRLKNVSGTLNLANNILTIKSINNDKLNVSGIYNMKTGMLDINGKLSNYTVYNTSNPEINLNVSELNANISGTLNKLNGNVELLGSKTVIGEEEIGETVGSFTLKDSVLHINRLKLRNNEIFGIYDLKNKNIDLTGTLDEPRISEIFRIKDLTFGGISNFNLKGTSNNFNLLGDIVLGNLSVKGYKIPYVVSKINYQNGDINKLFKYGKLDVEKFEIRGEDKKRLFETKTSLDLANLDVDYKLENQKFILEDSKDLKEKGYSGEVEVNLILKGNLDNHFADLKVKSDKLILSGFPVENLDIDAQMNKAGLNIGNFYLEYEKNPLLLNGYLEFKPLSYNMVLLAKNFNLDFLGVNKNVKLSSGFANIDMLFTNKETNGKLLLDNFNYITKDGMTKVENLNVDIGVLNRKLNINKFIGKYNDGIVKIEGNLDIPKISKDFGKTKEVELGEVEIKANLDNVGLKYGKDIDLNVSGDATFTENNLIGALNINSGEIRKIPNFDEKETSESKKKQDLKEKTIAEKIVSEILDKLLKQSTVDLSVQANKDLKINIQDVKLVKEIKGEIIGDSKIHYNSGEVNLVGDFSVKKGSFNLNRNKFNIDTAEIRFSNFGEINSNNVMNPLVDFEASTTINGEKIIVGMNGMLNNSEITLKSSSGMTQSQILSLLAISRISGNITNQNSLVNNQNDEKNLSTAIQNADLLNKVTDNLLNELIFSPVTGKIGRAFGLTNFSINTETENSNQNQYVSKVRTYLQNSLYKNKVFWNLEIKIPFRYSTSTSNTLNNTDSKFNYNFWLNYDFANGLSLKTGLETINVDKEKINNESGNKLNYYIGANLSSKAYSFRELIKKILPNKKKEKLKTK